MEFHNKAIAFVQATWHRDIVDECRAAFEAAVHLRGARQMHVDFFEVPGAFELPLFAKKLAKTGLYAGITAAGFVVDGGIYRHEFVATAVINGLMQVQLETDVPIFSAVLTPHHFHAADEHVDFFRSHFKVKGQEVAHACMDTIEKSCSLELRFKL
jgi:6,7-dimethyl-8-ribityllumazine synthase